METLVKVWNNEVFIMVWSDPLEIWRKEDEVPVSGREYPVKGVSPGLWYPIKTVSLLSEKRYPIRG